VRQMNQKDVPFEIDWWREQVKLMDIEQLKNLRQECRIDIRRGKLAAPMLPIIREALKAKRILLAPRENPKDVTAWLAETAGLCIGKGNGKLKWVTFTDPLAIRFDTKAEAEEFIRENKLEGAVATDHMWCAP